MGLGVLKEPFSIIPLKRLVILLTIESEKGRSIGRCHFQCKKKIGVLEMGFKKWVCSKMVKNTKILKDVEGDE